MIWIYRLLYLPGLLIALPYYLLRMWRRGGYKKDFQHRLGRFSRLSPPAEGRTRIWLQAVSVGEILAVGPLIKALQSDGTVEIVLTTTTSTGYAEARKRYTDVAHSLGIFPLDFWLFSRVAWARIRPDCIILTESELWPEHLHQAKRRGVSAYLVNARMSDTSFRRYQKVPTFARRMLSKFKATFAASDLDASRLNELGIESEKLHSTGSIKLDVPLAKQLSDSARKELRSELGFGSESAPLILLGSSTWPGEEEALIGIVEALRNEGTDLRLLLVPRHAERGPELRRLLEQQNLSWHQRSTGAKPEGEVVIHLADTTGELSRLTQLADMAFIGKSLAPNDGGQTPIEAAGNGVPLLMGPNMTNFKAVAKSLVECGAAHTVEDATSLEGEVRTLAQNGEQRTTMGEAGREWHAHNRGSSQRIADIILKELEVN